MANMDCMSCGDMTLHGLGDDLLLGTTEKEAMMGLGSIGVLDSSTGIQAAIAQGKAAPAPSPKYTRIASGADAPVRLSMAASKAASMAAAAESSASKLMGRALRAGASDGEKAAALKATVDAAKFRSVEPVYKTAAGLVSQAAHAAQSGNSKAAGGLREAAAHLMQAAAVGLSTPVRVSTDATGRAVVHAAQQLNVDRAHPLPGGSGSDYESKYGSPHATGTRVPPGVNALLLARAAGMTTSVPGNLTATRGGLAPGSAVPSIFKQPGKPLVSAVPHSQGYTHVNLTSAQKAGLRTQGIGGIPGNVSLSGFLDDLKAVASKVGAAAEDIVKSAVGAGAQAAGQSVANSVPPGFHTPDQTAAAAQQAAAQLNQAATNTGIISQAGNWFTKFPGGKLGAAAAGVVALGALAFGWRKYRARPHMAGWDY
jgi:hypothetical protein